MFPFLLASAVSRYPSLRRVFCVRARCPVCSLTGTDGSLESRMRDAQEGEKDCQLCLWSLGEQWKSDCGMFGFRKRMLVGECAREMIEIWIIDPVAEDWTFAKGTSARIKGAKLDSNVARVLRETEVDKGEIKSVRGRRIIYNVNRKKRRRRNVAASRTTNPMIRFYDRSLVKFPSRALSVSKLNVIHPTPSFSRFDSRKIIHTDHIYGIYLVRVSWRRETWYRAEWTRECQRSSSGSIWKHAWMMLWAIDLMIL